MSSETFASNLARVAVATLLVPLMRKVAMSATSASARPADQAH